MNKLDYAAPPAPHTNDRAKRSAAITRAAILWPALLPPSLFAGMGVLGPILDSWVDAAICMTLPIGVITFLALWRTLRAMRVLRRTRQHDAWVITQVAVAVDVLVLVAVGCVVLAL